MERNENTIRNNCTEQAQVAVLVSAGVFEFTSSNLLFWATADIAEISAVVAAASVLIGVIDARAIGKFGTKTGVQ